MPIFKQGDIVRVPFPSTDRDTRQRRPALVVSAGQIGENAALLWVVMITSAENRPLEWRCRDSRLRRFWFARSLGRPSGENRHGGKPPCRNDRQIVGLDGGGSPDPRAGSDRGLTRYSYSGRLMFL
ncbi:type II toxin-antitoxin system PemK/MazF family toxin [Rhizobium sullae]|uniref:type II toxin-antitoxin system PemK/MazF family toxin n=1 Tax=Rhizobium sullae TaxID=50338 RepID=UPI001FCD1DFE|nr:type II toxin-antitoxin system PemK/MazF family toxin [Rhizobium sullae]